MTDRYFMRPVLGSLLPKYFVLADDGRTVTKVLRSCPDGACIAEPAHVRFEAPRAETVASTKRQFNSAGLPPLKLCPKCRARKRREYFTPIGMTGRLASWCKACTSEHRRVKTREAA
jgi:hypothetical protein